MNEWRIEKKTVKNSSCFTCVDWIRKVFLHVDNNKLQKSVLMSELIAKRFHQYDDDFSLIHVEHSKDVDEILIIHQADEHPNESMVDSIYEINIDIYI